MPGIVDVASPTLDERNFFSVFFRFIVLPPVLLFVSVFFLWILEDEPTVSS